MLTATAQAETGPSSSDPPYLVPVAPGVGFTSILTVGDSVHKNNTAAGTYRMVGLPDGLGAYDNGGGTFTVLMNHELTNLQGVARAHGGKGAFVSKWQIRKSDLAVLNGEDLMTNIMLWDPIGETYVNGFGEVFSRFCSADLPAVSALFNSHTGKGFNEGRIFMNGEEDDGAGFGRAMAHLAGGLQQGTSYELPLMGRHPWENLVANPYEQDKTVVAGLEDGDLAASHVFIYIGEKQFTGSPIDKAGLTNGTLYAMAIAGFAVEPVANGFSGTFSLVAPGGGTGLNRVEDGQWDPTDPSRLYFVTTASFGTNSRLWLATFDDITQPELGGTIKVIIDGNSVAFPQIKMMDNITVDGEGNVYIQEDVGNNARLGQVWKYEPKTKKITNLAQHDPTRFLIGGADFMTQDEESSGVIEVTGMFEGVEGYSTESNRYFLLDVQSHNANADLELVQDGQLLLMAVPRAGVPNDGKGK
jgi:hypothetical protein